MTLDRYGRNIHYLRISLTDHCNLRCIYCMPEDATFQPVNHMLHDEEILRLVSIFTKLGFDKFRLTGGEPTVRGGIVDLVSGIAHQPGVRTLTMTTNGILFSRMAQQLADAGLSRANFSMDTLDPVKFRWLTRGGSLDHVWAGIQAAEQAGLSPIKINTVVVRNYNEEDVVELARLTLQNPWQIRFIEMMPFGGVTELQLNQVVSAAEILTRIEEELGPLTPLNEGALDGEARLYKLPSGLGEIGIIATVTRPFCDSCSRVRLTADGRLRLCLLREDEVDLLTSMRTGASDNELCQIIADAIWHKPWGNGLADQLVPLNRTMGQIGG